jgi:hypothetical protein
VVEPSARPLIEEVRAVAGRRHLCLEEGTLAGWLSEVLEPHVHALVVVGVSESRGQKSDRLDAFGLAEQLRIGAIGTKVYKKRGQFGRLGHLGRAYGWRNGERYDPARLEAAEATAS